MNSFYCEHCGSLMNYFKEPSYGYNRNTGEHNNKFYCVCPNRKKNNWFDNIFGIENQHSLFILDRIDLEDEYWEEG